MAHDWNFEREPVHGGEDEDWGGPWGRGPHGRHGHWGRGPRGRGFGPEFGPGFGPGMRKGFGPFGGFGPFDPEQNPERAAFGRVAFDVMRLVRAGLLASGGNTARLTQLRGILEHTRDELNAFLGQPSSGSDTGDGPTPTSDTSGSVI